MADRVGQQLGNYRLIRLLGQGSFAEVYLGEHIHLETEAAIKVLQTQLASEDVEQFRTEARLIAHLIHPHIVRVLEFGVEGTTPFLVMDYAPGGTLRKLHPKGTRLPLHTVVAYVQQIAPALQYAHEHKLIHRDIKPENLLVGRINEILLSDFGIALVAQSSRYQSTQDMAGTIAYMAPEQIEAHPRPASDQYSLGIVVYEWLSGERPFHGSFTEIAIKHSLVPPPSLREKLPTLPFAVEQVVMTALAKDPKQRWASVQAFANALEQASQADAATFVKPPTPGMQPPEKVAVPSSLPLALPVAPPLSPTLPTVISQPMGTTLLTYGSHSSKVTTLAWAPDSRYLVSGCDDGTLRVWDRATESKVLSYHGHSAWILAVMWSPDGSRIASASFDGTMQVWNAATGDHAHTYQWRSLPMAALAWSPNGQHIAVGFWDGLVQVLNTDFKKGFSRRRHSRIVSTLAWSPDGQRILSGSWDGKVKILDAIRGDEVFTYFAHFGEVYSAAWSPDGMSIVWAGIDKAVQVWRAGQGRKIVTYNGHTDSVQAVAWSPDSKHIASASRDSTVQVWNATTGEITFTYRHSAPACTVAWSPDGKYIASGGEDKTVQVWVAPS
jgi:eukaryotic-like serine/threonine-protein kinase